MSARTSDWAMVQMQVVTSGTLPFLEPEAMVLAALGLWSIEYFWSISAEEREACLVIFLG